MNWSYIAGFFDGEGCITWSKNQTGKRYPYLTMSNTNRYVLDSINRFLLEHGIRSKVYSWQSKESIVKGWKQKYWLAIQDKTSIEDCIFGMIPHLIVKASKAEDTLELLEGVTARVSIREGKLTRTEYQRKLREHKSWVYDYKGDLVVKYK